MRLQKMLQNLYLAKLNEWIYEEHAKKLFQLHQQITGFLHMVKSPQQRETANHLKNEIIVEMRSLLDRAFLAFYRNSYGEPPPRVNAYFLVVPKLQRGSVKDELQYYFNSLLKTPNFSRDFPELFDYLLQIQPLHNEKYRWLDVLYRLANTQA